MGFARGIRLVDVHIPQLMGGQQLAQGDGRNRIDGIFNDHFLITGAKGKDQKTSEKIVCCFHNHGF